jgi:hypothetical protein
MGTGVALSQVQELVRENAALRQERDGLLQRLAALGHADAEDDPPDPPFSRWPNTPLRGTGSYRNGHGRAAEPQEPA